MIKKGIKMNKKVFIVLSILIVGLMIVIIKYQRPPIFRNKKENLQSVELSKYTGEWHKPYITYKTEDKVIISKLYDIANKTKIQKVRRNAPYEKDSIRTIYFVFDNEDMERFAVDGPDAIFKFLWSPLDPMRQGYILGTNAELCEEIDKIIEEME